MCVWNTIAIWQVVQFEDNLLWWATRAIADMGKVVTSFKHGICIPVGVS